MTPLRSSAKLLGGFGVVALLAAVFGYWWLRAPTPASRRSVAGVAALAEQEQQPAHAKASGGATKQQQRPTPAPARSSGPKLDRKQRDEVRESVYKHLGQPLPTADLRTQPLPPSPVVLDKSYIQRRIKADFIPLALQCYESLLSTQPDARGKAVVSFTIVGDQSVGGIVESAELVDGTTLNEPEFATCMRESLLSVVFEPPQQGGWVTVTYPFDFSPDDPDQPPTSASRAR